ncbi:MetQ/NlpA family ABC transporter substrate-binding protein [Clostridium grantii]|uniref:Lipoprotein n=1 Tax=Clostridium grantii DSM 8605 TaxID=1121316 RepID=A0A1M5QI50_9CLOT|nr:MetQ/NlpA family ABC transporter substrate-binding protein [Clostridium grantii]SHH13586.1 D-methionine transport system substrate-binding protein [Clostridium grantii DSM 8605]
MKKLSLVLTTLMVTASVLVGCSTVNNIDSSSTEQSNNELKKIVVGATPVPHVEILNVVKPILQEKGYELEIKEFTDYVTPNIALNDKELDANFFQHVPYMEEFAANNNMELVSVAKVHVEPLGAYSDKLKSIEEIVEGATVAIPNDATNEGRALILLQEQGIIKLKDATGLTQTPLDIVENPKNLKFQELEAAQLPRVLQDVDFAIINTNFALEADLNPTKDALFIENADSPYANILTVRPDNAESEEIKALVEALNSDEVKKFIEENYKGSIVPAF